MSKNIFSNEKLLLALRIIMGGIFILASVDKIMNPSMFSMILREYKLIPGIFIPLVAVTLPWVEFFTGIFMIANIFAQSCALIMIGLNIGYIIGIVLNLIWGLVHECGCFTIFGLNEPIGGFSIARDAVFILLCLPLLIYGTNEIKLKKQKERQILPS
ncbi:MAG: hypothetical protein A2452_09415 [Candidatus Firestonebacteria bacterium RIFOXYC2_FULL_39_67]|nr:MAG: hypothetical protein A2536_00005 [Candidatus Firestonebacteria bacterium RIFOXYD2_FULL_39_29]OGF55732.1 MAG: hypothetical protein A2452_09415 [Candidatus Firestonebacteria bacterium RIFOXYC2_FULL_39_67]